MSKAKRDTAKRSYRRPNNKPRSRISNIIYVLVALVFAAVMVFLAQRSARPEVNVDVPVVQSYDFTPQSAQSADVEPEPQPEPEPAPVLPAPAAPTRLVAASEDALLRATVGQCGQQAATMEISYDQGASWGPVNLGAFPGNSQILSITPLGNYEVRMALLDDACNPQFGISYISGGGWDVLGNGSNQWFVTAGSNVQGPAASADLACVPVQVTGWHDRGIVLCDNGTVTVSGDGGATWSAPADAPGAVAVAAGEDNFFLAYAGLCDGIQVGTFNGAVLSAPGACLAAPAEGVAFAVTDNTVYMWAGEQWTSSTDRGQTWL